MSNTGSGRADPSRGVAIHWPADGGPLSFEDIADPIIKAIRFAYKLERRNRRRTIPWRGPEIDRRDQACCPPIAERFRAGNLAYSEDDQGRDALEEIISAAIQLGIAQGRRLARSDASELLDEFSGAVFTVRVGWDDFASVHTQSGLNADPVECLRKGIQELVDELSRVQRCPRHRALCRDRDRNPEGIAQPPSEPHP